MDNRQDDWDREWAGFEPGRKGLGSWGCWLGMVLLSCLLLTVCVGAVYLAWQRLELPLQPGSFLTPPTAVSGAEMTAVADDLSTHETPSFAPTVTLVTANDNGKVEAKQLPFVPLLDGHIQEWSEIPSYDSQYLVYNVANWDGTDDLTARWRLGWDALNLYISVEVEDELHVQTQTGNQIFKGDGVSLQIDSERDADFDSRLSPDDFQINLSPGDFSRIAPSAFRFRGANDGSAVDAPGHNVKIAAQKTDVGYTLEAAIPWQDLNISPVPDLIIGLALNANDNDSPGTAVQEVMKSHVATRAFRDPTSWGTLTLR